MKLLLIAGISWLISQIIKQLIVGKGRGISPRLLLESGGMPSSHTAMVVALAVAVSLEEGFRSSLFAVTATFTLIVAYDAMGVRQAVMEQAKFLNKVRSHLTGGKGEWEELRHRLGHRPVEVAMGAALGVGLGGLLC